MYRWQTLTLARIEHLNPLVPSSQYAAVRDLLFTIGSRQFPDPTVTFPPSPSDAAWMSLRWSVDDRVWEVSVNRKGECRSELHAGNEAGADGLLPTDRERVAECAHWLLFGQPIAKAVEPLKPMQPPPGSCFLSQ